MVDEGRPRVERAALRGIDEDRRRGRCINDREYLTVGEVAAALALKAKTVRNRMPDGTWRRGEHWFHPRGIGPRFRWSAVVRWLEEDPRPSRVAAGAAYGPDIPPPRQRRPRKPLPMLHNK